MTPTRFGGGEVEVGGVRVSYLEAGQGMPLVHLQAAAAPRPTPAHVLLAHRFRVLIVAVPEAPWSVDTLVQVLTALGLDAVSLVGTSASAAGALRLALQAPERVRALVLEAPATIPAPDRETELERCLPALATPTLILLGTRDDQPPAMGHVCKALIPGSHLVYVYDAAHAISVDRPEAFAEVVADFVERHDAFVISRARTIIHP